MNPEDNNYRFKGLIPYMISGRCIAVNKDLRHFQRGRLAYFDASIIIIIRYGILKSVKYIDTFKESHLK